MAEETLRFGSGRDALRSEDEPLLTGRGRFTDDLAQSGAAHAAFVRAPVGHGVVKGVDVAAAAKMPGVVAIFTGADLERDGIGAIPPAVLLPGRGGKQMIGASMPVLAAQRVRYVGEPVAIVVAETAAQAQDAAEAVVLDLDELPAVSDVARAAAAGAPAIWDEAPGNVSLDWEDGDAQAVEAAFASAAHVARVKLLDTRVAVAAMEPRAAIGAWDAAFGRYTLTAGTQGVALVRKMLAESVFKVPPQQIRVLTHDVGGGFGMKVQVYPEYAAVLYAAKRVGRPVKWRASRLESFLADTPGRDGLLEGELALGADGKFLALRVRTMVGIGAYTSTFSAVIATNNTKNCLSSVYVIPAIHIGVKMVFTNAMPLGPYRGAGRPEAIYLIERLIDVASRATGHRPRDAATEEPDPGRRRCRTRRRTARLRQRRVRGGARQGARARRLERLRGAARGVGARGQAARARDLLLPRGRRREPAVGHRGSPLRGRRQGRAPDRRAGDRAGASHDVPAGRRGSGSASR